MRFSCFKQHDPDLALVPTRQLHTSQLVATDNKNMLTMVKIGRGARTHIDWTTIRDMNRAAFLRHLMADPLFANTLKGVSLSNVNLWVLLSDKLPDVNQPFLRAKTTTQLGELQTLGSVVDACDTQSKYMCVHVELPANKRKL
jgi:hypothetical protein